MKLLAPQNSFLNLAALQDLGKSRGSAQQLEHPELQPSILQPPDNTAKQPATAYLYN